uniref:Thioredoxin domain-containing protein n=1 Tax=Macrostomum lignano TaxID=282301 RepID=A0A1I8IYS8_9PLAT
SVQHVLLQQRPAIDAILRQRLCSQSQHVAAAEHLLSQLCSLELNPQQQPGRQPKQLKKMTGNAQLEKVLETQMVRAAKMIEQRLDNEIERLRTSTRTTWSAAGAPAAPAEGTGQAAGRVAGPTGTAERDFFDESMRSKRLVCHFYRDTTFRCGIVDATSPRWRRATLSANSVEKAPFLTRRLGVRVIPTLCIVKDEKVKDYIVGFDDLGGHDNFSTEMLEWRLARSEVIDYRGDLETPPDSAAGRQQGELRRESGKGGKGGKGDQSLLNSLISSALASKLARKNQRTKERASFPCSAPELRPPPRGHADAWHEARRAPEKVQPDDAEDNILMILQTIF